MSISELKNQILSQNTTNRWTGQGFGSAESNAEDMAKILDSIGITDIRQFGQFETTINKKQTVLPEYKYVDQGDSSYSVPTGRYYIPQYSVVGDSQEIVGKEYVDPAIVKKTTSGGSGWDSEPTITYTAEVPTKQTVYGNKVTGQAVPTTYGERQTGNAWGGTFAGKGNTGYRVQFSPDGTPYFYTTGASSSDVADLAPMIGLGLMFVPGLQGIGASIGAALAPAAGAAIQAGIGNAIVQGAISEATGGDFLKGAALSGVGSLAGGLQPGLSDALGGGAVGDIASKALIGGGMSELSGGDFTQGALISGIGAGIDQAKLAAAEDYLQSLPGGYEIDAAPAPTEADVLAAIGGDSYQAPVIDTTFTTDYSLSSGASGEPGFVLKPLNTEYQVGSFDYTLGDLIDSLGLQMPTTPNLESMGGGQGIIVKTNDGYITESGFIPDYYLASLGDPESFINKPVIDVQLSLGELKEATPEDISAKLAGLDIAKALAPTALAALTKKVIDVGDSASGFPIVQVPADWKSPQYNMAFTPSAPINFGTADLLKGTQWEKPMDLGSLINAINSQSSVFNTAPDILQQFNQPYTVGVNDKIGNLNGSPVSISDIIAGIQSQYGQTPTIAVG